MMGGINEILVQAFTEIEPTRELHYFEEGQPVATWLVTVCRGFKGFPEKQGKGAHY
jgi:hypothetical protein